MKRMIGFILFWVAVGMIIALFIENLFIHILIVLVLILLGYNLFCC